MYITGDLGKRCCTVVVKLLIPGLMLNIIGGVQLGKVRCRLRGTC